MIRSELLAALATENPGLRPEEVARVVDVFFDEIAQRLAAGGRVELREAIVGEHLPTPLGKFGLRGGVAVGTEPPRPLHGRHLGGQLVQ